MTARLASMTYWIFTSAAALWLFITIAFLFAQPVKTHFGLYLPLTIGTAVIIAAPLWLVGRLFKYAMTGR
jgi:K+ transporter